MPKHGAGFPQDCRPDVSAVRAAERGRIARDLHDTVIQPLAGLVTSLECAQRQPPAPDALDTYLAHTKGLAREALESLRRALAGLTVHPHVRKGLLDAVQRHLVPELHAYGIRARVESVGWPEGLSLALSTSLYLIIREAVTNVEKHAHATSVTLHFRADAAYLSISVADDGVGLSTTSWRETRPGDILDGGLGLDSIRTRVRELGGVLTIASAPGQGTRLDIRVMGPLSVGTLPGAVGAGLPTVDGAEAPVH